jgi:hypothetical protein
MSRESHGREHDRDQATRAIDKKGKCLRGRPYKRWSRSWLTSGDLHRAVALALQTWRPNRFKPEARQSLSLAPLLPGLFLVIGSCL